MDCHLCIADVLEDAFVGWQACALVVLGLEAVDRHHHIELLEFFQALGITRKALVTTCV